MAQQEVKFRSVFPHEPLPKESQGYVHIQGAFLPRNSNKLLTTDADHLGDDDEAGNNNGHQDSSTGSSSIDLLRLERAILQSLVSDHHGLPHRVQSVHLLDPSSPPYTKARLVYASPREARDMVAYLRNKKMTPKELFGRTMRSIIMDNNQDANNSWSSRPIQATQVTTNPLPPSCDDVVCCWNRSNPPKFRRLFLPRSTGNDGDDGDKDESLLANLERQRAETRFVFVTGLIKDDNDEEEEEVDNVVPPVGGTATHNKLLYSDSNAFLDALREWLDPFDSSGYGVEIFLPNKKKKNNNNKLLYNKCCHVGMRSHTDAEMLIRSMQGMKIDWRIRSDEGDELVVTVVQSGTLFLDYADLTHRSYTSSSRERKGEPVKGEPPKSECTSTTHHISVPGLVLVENYISQQEQEVLLAVLRGPDAPWVAPSQSTPSHQNGVVMKRRVQHYGYVFDYETADVLRDRNSKEAAAAACPPMPALPMAARDLVNNRDDEVQDFISTSVHNRNGWAALAGIIERTRRIDFESYQHACPREPTTAPAGARVERNGIRFRQTPQDGEKVEPSPQSFPNLNQLTVNEYEPGQGIGSHIDTPSAFGDGLISITLNGGVVMEFRDSSSDSTKQLRKKLVYLPPRSLLLLSGPARYQWEHMIVSRSTDTVNGIVIPRKLRVSLTLRTALQRGRAVGDDALPLELVESAEFPPRWRLDSNALAIDSQGGPGNTNAKDSVEGTPSALVTPETERHHVHAVYDAIATQWHHTRGKRGVLWPGATQFLTQLPPGSIVADVGCGDGKYFPAIWEAGSYVIGMDMSLPLLRTAVAAASSKNAGVRPDSRLLRHEKQHLNKYPAVAAADCMNIPIRTGTCDAAICIAVMHHLSNYERRMRCLQELARIVRVGGTINVQAWALEQQEGSRRKFAGTDVFVPFNAQPRYLDKVPQEQTSEAVETKSVARMYSEAYDGTQYDESKGLVVFQRYCHLYRKGELEALASSLPNVELIESGYESGNYFIVLRRRHATE